MAPRMEAVHPFASFFLLHPALDLAARSSGAERGLGNDGYLLCNRPMIQSPAGSGRLMAPSPACSIQERYSASV